MSGAVNMATRPLAVIGNVNVDIIIGAAEPWPQPGTEILVDHGEVRVGGAAGNAALAWQAMGVDFQIAGNTGNDQFGTWLRQSFPDHSKNWPVEQTPTTFSVGVTHPDGERTFFTIPGHMPHLDLGTVRRSLDIDQLRGGIALICGSFLTDHLTVDYPALFAWLSAHEIEIALDTGWPPAGWTEETRARVQSWLPACTHVLLNEVEIMSLTGADDIDAAMDLLSISSLRSVTIVAKLGAAGAKGCRILPGGARQMAAVPAPSVSPVDTIGAGDVFNAGYLAAAARGLDLQAALAAGVGIASRAISTLPRRYDSVAA
ncbi:carbohydrate kinase family protein [Dongia sp.]|uniref:carbohydrate kinase family protein n=1 Tax=Dongia sp. TaxID=1977262 RepID=UPI0035AFB286